MSKAKWTGVFSFSAAEITGITMSGLMPKLKLANHGSILIPIAHFCVIGGMKCILVHELVHACGLENKDHGTDDLFHGFPQTNCGDRASDDKIGIRSDGQYIRFPPIYLSSATLGKIKALW